MPNSPWNFIKAAAHAAPLARRQRRALPREARPAHAGPHNLGTGNQRFGPADW
jgi:hypothetical protein